MLKALRKALSGKEAEKTPCGCKDDYLTEGQLHEILEDYMKQINFEWTEWYEKFDKLHMRLSKREQRKREVVQDEQESIPLSVLPYRRITSV